MVHDGRLARPNHYDTTSAYQVNPLDLSNRPCPVLGLRSVAAGPGFASPKPLWEQPAAGGKTSAQPIRFISPRLLSNASTFLSTRHFICLLHGVDFLLDGLMGI